jgi:outer membrane protein, heavy metal efflux system
MNLTTIAASALAPLLVVAAPPERVVAEPKGVLTLRDVVTAVLGSSPELAAHALEIQAAEAQSRHAGQWHNPDVTIEIEDAAGSDAYRGIDQAQTTLQLGQLIELGGKASARRSAAESIEQRVRRDFEVRRATVLTEATGRFVHVVGDQHRLELAREARKLAEAALAVAQRRVNSGAASNVEERRARILLARARIEEEHAEHELAASRRRLAASWGSTAPTFSEARADLFARTQLPVFDELAARIDANPELASLVSERAVRDAQVAVAESRAAPDLRVFAGARRLEGPDAITFLAGASLPIPLFNRNQGAVGDAEARRAQLDHDEQRARVAALTALFGNYQELAHVVTELDTIERDVLPQAEAMLRTLDEGFKLGRFSQLELFDAQRTLLEVREERIDAAEEYHGYIARLERLLGGPLFATARESDAEVRQR